MLMPPPQMLMPLLTLFIFAASSRRCHFRRRRCCEYDVPAAVVDGERHAMLAAAVATLRAMPCFRYFTLLLLRRCLPLR